MSERYITTPKFERLRRRLLKALKEKTLDPYMTDGDKGNE